MLQFLVFLIALLFCPALQAQESLAEQPASPESWLKLAVKRLCPAPNLTGIEAEAELPGAWFLSERLVERPGGQQVGRSQVFALPGDDELRIHRSEPGGQLRRFTAEVFARHGETLRPHMQVIADANCTARAGRRIRHEDKDAVFLDQLDGDLNTLRWTETLQAPWPKGADPGGIRVAMIDSGLAYDLPHVQNRLARDSSGTPLGYDFWDMDTLPYDGDASRGPFLPIRHGSAVASILLREAPNAAVIPYRYPAPDMSRMKAVLSQAAKADARIIAMPLGSNDPADWIGFKEGMEDHPNLLAIVSAGNNGRNLDLQPLYPASLNLPNVIVVTSADGFGRLAPGVNWGPKTVDIMLPAENVPVIDFRGAKGTASGSSYAVPRLAALAARILERNPGLTIEELKAAIFARATQSPYEAEKRVSAGWIPDPDQDR